MCPEDVSILTPFKSVITVLSVNPLLFATRRKKKGRNLKKEVACTCLAPVAADIQHVSLSLRAPSCCRRPVPPNSGGLFQNKSIIQETGTAKKMAARCWHPPAWCGPRRCLVRSSPQSSGQIIENTLGAKRPANTSASQFPRVQVNSPK